MSPLQTIDRTTSQALSMALAVLGLSACEEDLLTRALIAGRASAAVRPGEEWSQAELTAAADALAHLSLVTRKPDGADVSVVDDITSAVVEAGRAHQRATDRSVAARRQSLHASIMSRVRKPPQILGAHGDVNEEFRDLLRHHTVMMGAEPMTALLTPAARLARRTAALEAQIKHTAPTSDVDVISAQLLKEPIEAEYFAAVDRQPGNCVKVLDDVPLRIAVLDGRTAVVPLNPHDACAGALLLDDQAAVEHVGLYLAMQVAKARPLPAAHTPELSGREFSVLRLLAQGLTDAAVARRLWICDRSVRRLIAALQRKLGVDSRFELAVEAGRRGLL